VLRPSGEPLLAEDGKPLTQKVSFADSRVIREIVSAYLGRGILLASMRAQSRKRASAVPARIAHSQAALDTVSAHLLTSDVLDRGAEATSSQAVFSETLRRLERKGCSSQFRRSRRRKLTPRRLGGQANTCPLSSVEKRMERYWEGSRLHWRLFFSSLHSFFTEDSSTQPSFVCS
jgi:hypothetical protein